MSKYLNQIIQDKLEGEKEAQKRKTQQFEPQSQTAEDVDNLIDENNTKRDEDWIQKFSSIVQEQSKNATQYFDAKLSSVEKKKQELEQKKQEILTKIPERKIVRLNVGGVDFEVDLATLVEQKDSLFIKAFKTLGSTDSKSANNF